MSLVPSSPAVSSCSLQLSRLLGESWGHPRTAGSHPLPCLLKLLSWGWGPWESLRTRLLTAGVRFTISRCFLVTRVQLRLQNLRFICVLFSSFHGNLNGSQSSAQEEWLAGPSSPASCQAFGEVQAGPEAGPAGGSAGRGRGPRGSWSAQGLRTLTGLERGYFPHLLASELRLRRRHVLQARQVGRTGLWARCPRRVASSTTRQSHGPHGQNSTAMASCTRGHEGLGERLPTHPVPLGLPHGHLQAKSTQNEPQVP